jgi:hypothetical protein
VRVSRTVKDLVAGSGIRFIDLGAHSLKGVPGEWDLFRSSSRRATCDWRLSHATLHLSCLAR